MGWVLKEYKKTCQHEGTPVVMIPPNKLECELCHKPAWGHFVKVDTKSFETSVASMFNGRQNPMGIDLVKIASEVTEEAFKRFPQLSRMTMKEFKADPVIQAWIHAEIAKRVLSGASGSKRY